MFSFTLLLTLRGKESDIFTTAIDGRAIINGDWEQHPFLLQSWESNKNMGSNGGKCNIITI